MKRSKFDHFSHKDYCFDNAGNWKLPLNAFQSGEWKLEQQQQMKRHLNSVKNKLSCYDLTEWSQHTRQRDPSTQILRAVRWKYKPLLLTQAWCKFYECLSYGTLLPQAALTTNQLKSLHLCEAPGGFISALNHFLVLRYPDVKLSWFANTMNPYYEGNSKDEMIPDDRLIHETQDYWLFGLDRTGDITKFYNSNWICDKIQNTLGKVDIVTADGSVDCMYDPGNQELHVAHLHYCETITALQVLQKGGTFVLKIFTAFEHQTICLLYLLCCVFVKVSAYKPITSKGGNSEIYILCKCYKGLEIFNQIWNDLCAYYQHPNKCAMFALGDIDKTFLDKVKGCAEYFMHKQISIIENNIKYFSCSADKYRQAESNNRTAVKTFLDMCRIYKIDNKQQLVPHCKQYHKQYTIASWFNYFIHSESSRNSLNVKIVVGKKVAHVLYSKYIDIDNVDISAIFNRNTAYQKSLFDLAITILQRSESLRVVDCTSINVKTQSEIHYWFFSEIDQLVSLHHTREIIIINLHLTSNFLVGLLYILSQSYMIVFCESGILRLLYDVTCKNIDAVATVLVQIRETYSKLRNINNLEEFQVDILELVPYCTYIPRFLHYVQNYNQRLCTFKHDDEEET